MWRKGCLILLLMTTPLAARKCIACAAEQTVYQMADGVVRPSRFPGAKEAYFLIVAPTSHAANLLALPNGDLLCVWYTGTGERNRGVSLALSRLDHGSHHWTLPAIVAYHPGGANQNPLVFRAPDGRLWLLYTSQRHGSSEATAIVYAASSNDHGHTWTEPSTLFKQPGLYLRQPLDVTPQDWLFPIYQEESGGSPPPAQKTTIPL